MIFTFFLLLDQNLPITLSLYAPGKTSHRFRFAPALLFILISLYLKDSWISKGLREFWGKATVFKLAAMD